MFYSNRFLIFDSSTNTKRQMRHLAFTENEVDFRATANEVFNLFLEAGADMENMIFAKTGSIYVKGELNGLDIEIRFSNHTKKTDSLFQANQEIGNASPELYWEENAFANVYNEINCIEIISEVKSWLEQFN